MNHSTRADIYRALIDGAQPPIQLPLTTTGEALSIYNAHNNYKSWLSRRTNSTRLSEEDRFTALALLEEARSILLTVTNLDDPLEEMEEAAPVNPLHAAFLPREQAAWTFIRKAPRDTPFPEGTTLLIEAVRPISNIPPASPAPDPSKAPTTESARSVISEWMNP
jgi:hypothetical protein